MATAEAGDEEMRQRIEEHRKARPGTWKTLETRVHLGSQISQQAGGARTVIIDCITLLVNNVFSQYGGHGDEDIDAASVEKGVMAEIDELVCCIKQVRASFIIVSNEVGLGLVPANKVSRLYRDLLGKANQKLAQHADEVYLMAAGIPLLMKPAGPRL